ncbi:MAG TPA: hypothetical protein VFM46_07785, partial [Pseudomonadales bacterium]|nr:hypothetical protein [Pseudomonadales bacterium]
AKAAIDDGKAQRLDFYAPLHLGLAEKSLEQARKLRSENAPAPEILQAAFTAEDSIKRGMRARTRVETQLQDAFTYFDFLKTIQAREAFPEDYAAQIERLKKVIRAVEQEDIQSVKEMQTQLTASMRELEVKTIKYQNLNKTIKTLEEAKKNDADDQAPKTYAEAQQLLQAASALIERNPRDTEKVAAASNLAYRAARHNTAIAKDVAMFRGKYGGLSAKELELVLLDIESYLQNIDRVVEKGDTKYMPLEQQTKLIADMIVKKQSGDSIDNMTVIDHRDFNYPPMQIDKKRIEMPTDENEIHEGTSITPVIHQRVERTR